MHHQFTPKQVARFWARVDTSGECWEWTGYRMPKMGYGAMYLGYKKERTSSGHAWPIGMTAHRFSWVLHFGSIPEGQWVLHRCDNPPCVRPDHLWLGTKGDNVRDMYAKGRGGYHGMPGEANHKAKLTEQQVYEMRAQYRALVNSLASRHEVTRSLIRQILIGKVWRHLLDEQALDERLPVALERDVPGE